MSKGIELSPKHGLNPTVLVCFFCGEDKNELALLGRVRSKKNSDVEAPRRAVLNTEPCDKCKAHMAQGVILISVRDNEADTDGNPYRSGGWVVLKAEAVERIFTAMFGEAHAAQVLEKRVAFLEDTVWKKIGLPGPSEEVKSQS